MPPAGRIDYPEVLLRRRAAILSSLTVDYSRNGDERVNEEDQGTVAHEEFVSMQMNRLDYAQLRLIDEALDRMETGDYGICISCEEEIPGKRLAAIPWARYCVSCQEQLSARPAPEERPFRLAN